MRGLTRALLATAACALLVACQQPAGEVRVHLAVSDGEGQPVEAAEVRLDGVPSGSTSSDGELWLRWSTERRGRIELALRCPPGFDDPEPRQLRARHPGVRRVRLHCASLSHRAFLAIAAPGGEGLPVRVDGEYLAAIPEAGVLHARVSRPTGSEVRLRIDTSARPHLRPQNPVVRARLERDEVIVLHQRFERSRPRRRSGRRHREPRPKRLRSL